MLRIWLFAEIIAMIADMLVPDSSESWGMIRDVVAVVSSVDTVLRISGRVGCLGRKPQKSAPIILCQGQRLPR